MIELLGFLITGVVLGFAAGISPGPLLALVFSETIKHGKKEGIKIAFSPLISDPMIIIFSFFILSLLAGYSFIIGLISLLGALYLLYLGLGNLRIKKYEKIDEFEFKEWKKDSLKKGVITNFLNPHPYLFWIMVGCPIIFKSLEVNVTASILFLAGLYASLVGSKIGLVLITEKSGKFLKNKYYFYAVSALGVFLILLGLIFAYEGLRLLGLI